MQMTCVMKNEIKGCVSHKPCQISEGFCNRRNSPSRFMQDLTALSKKSILTPKRRKSLKTILEGEIESLRCPDALSTYTLGDMYGEG